MNVPRSLFYLGELNGQLYAIAGWTAVNEDTPTVERYTPSLDSWQRLKNFLLDVHEHAGHLVIHILAIGSFKLVWLFSHYLLSSGLYTYTGIFKELDIHQ